MPFIVSKTYDIVTPESAQQGDVAESGFEYENEPMSLRETIAAIKDIGAETGSDGYSWYSADAHEDYRTGESTTYAVHVKANSHNMKRLWDALHLQESARMYARRQSSELPRSNPMRSKYDGIAGFLYSSDYCDKEESYEHGGGWYGYYSGPITPTRAERREHELDRDEVEELRECVAVIVHEDSQGFLDYDVYENDDDAEAAWDEIEEEVGASYEDEDVDE